MLYVKREDGRVDPLLFEFFEEEVRLRQIGPETLIRFEPVTGESFLPAAELELYRSVEDSRRTLFERSFSLGGLPSATLSFAFLLVGVFLWQVQSGGGFVADGLVEQGAKSMAHQRELGEWWRLITGSLLHSGWTHLIFNLLFLVHVGRNVEALVGPGGVALLVAISGPGSMGVSSWATDVPTVGASGVTFAFFGAAVALGWRYSDWLPRSVRGKYGWPIVPFVGFFLVFSVLWPGIDNFCHFGGLLIGGLLGLSLPSPLERSKKRRRSFALVECGVALAVVVTVATVLPLAWELGVMPTSRVDRSPTVLEEAGVSLRVPRNWPRVARSVPGSGWSSLTGEGQVSVQTWVEELGVLNSADVLHRWRDELAEKAIVLERSSPSNASLGLDEKWIVMEVDLVTSEERLRLLRIGLVRGSYLSSIDFLHPIDSWETYESLRDQVIASIEMKMPAAVVRALDELLSDTMLTGGEVLPYLDVIASRSVNKPAEMLRVAAEVARVGDASRADRLLASLESQGSFTEETGFWRLWVQHYLEGVANDDALVRSRALLRLRADSLLTTALAWSIADSAGEQEAAQALLDQLATRWPKRAATLSERRKED